MLHDPILESVTNQAGAATEMPDRRRSHRVPFPAELTLVWHHDLHSPMRYRISDASDGGFRIISTVPLHEGMTGMVLKVLPGGESIDHCIMVTWSRRRNSEASEYEIGLRYF